MQVDNYFAFAVSPWGYDPDFIHCYPVSFDGAEPLKPQQDSCTTITHVVPYNNISKELAYIKVVRTRTHKQTGTHTYTQETLVTGKNLAGGRSAELPATAPTVVAMHATPIPSEPWAPGPPAHPPPPPSGDPAAKTPPSIMVMQMHSLDTRQQSRPRRRDLPPVLLRRPVGPTRRHRRTGAVAHAFSRSEPSVLRHISSAEIRKVLPGQDGDFLSGGLESQCADQPPPTPYIHQVSAHTPP